MPVPHKITRVLMAAMMQSREPMVLTDPNTADHPMIAINGAFEALTGYEASDTLGKNCRFLQGEGTDKATTARIRGHLAAQRGCVEWIVNYRRDGSMFWNLLFLSPVFTREGKLLHYFGNQRDITTGAPPTLPDYTLGRADMPEEGQKRFQSLLLDLLDEEGSFEVSARRLERLVEAARELDRVTTGLAAAKWEYPG
jgi:PAS domain S-box-containing protein